MHQTSRGLLREYWAWVVVPVVLVLAVVAAIVLVSGNPGPSSGIYEIF